MGTAARARVWLMDMAIVITWLAVDNAQRRIAVKGSCRVGQLGVAWCLCRQHLASTLVSVKSPLNPSDTGGVAVGALGCCCKVASEPASYRLCHRLCFALLSMITYAATRFQYPRLAHIRADVYVNLGRALLVAFVAAFHVHTIQICDKVCNHALSCCDGFMLQT